MKKFLAVTLIVLICVSGGIAQAVVHSTRENFNYVFKTCISAINETEDYSKLIIDGNYDVALIRRRDCDILEDSIGFLSDNSAEGAESMVCALETRVILQARYAALDYYISALEAGVAGKMNVFEEYKRKMLKSIEEAEQFRQAFRNKYGY